MKEKLRDYIEKVFEDAPKTLTVVELKEEILQNLFDKYDDLLAEGKSEEAAFNLAVANLGDITELIEGLKKETKEKNDSNKLVQKQREENKKKSALIQSIAVMMYIVCVVPILLLQNEFGVICMFLLIGVATAMLIYDEKMNKKYKKVDDSVVEEFKEWNAQKNLHKGAQKHIISAMWSVTVALYLIISFWSGAWHITWVIFLAASAVKQAIMAYFELRE